MLNERRLSMKHMIRTKCGLSAFGICPKVYVVCFPVFFGEKNFTSKENEITTFGLPYTN